MISGARVFSAFTREWLTGDVAISGGRIAGVGAYDGGERIDGARAATSCPGSSTPTCTSSRPSSRRCSSRGRSCRAGRPRWSATRTRSPTSPGSSGVEWLLGATEGLPLDVFVMAPSCVPGLGLRVARRAARAGRDAGDAAPPAGARRGRDDELPGRHRGRSGRARADGRAARRRARAGGARARAERLRRRRGSRPTTRRSRPPRRWRSAGAACGC